ncbi:MAG: ferritin family protein [Pseudomonadota bacterium]
MSETAPLDILKSAILLERRGRAYYENAAEASKDPSVAAFFKMMAEEEVQHISILAEQYKRYRSENRFEPVTPQTPSPVDVAESVLSAIAASRISAADFESAAVSAAMALEERAIRLYADRAKVAADPDEKALYGWLAAWESEHLAMLSRIDRALTETIWNDNQFWPF